MNEMDGMAGMVGVKIGLRGAAPLLMHRGGMADPLDPWARAVGEITAKRKKTEEDRIELARREFMGSMYWDEEVGVYLPAEAIEATIREGGKENKHGKIMTSAVFCLTDKVRIEHDGPKDRDGLWAAAYSDSRMTNINQKKVMRTRPRFNRWALSCDLLVDTRATNLEDVQTALENAGRLKGLGDYRPRFGRFIVASFEETSAAASATV